MLTYYVVDNLEVLPVIDGKINSIFFDLENLHKEKRQPDNFIISDAKFDDLTAARRLIKRSEFLVRINPMNSNTENEIDLCCSAGADVIMLPYFKAVEEVVTFCNLVENRSKCCLLVETPEAIMNLNKILHYCKIDRVHFGLNDLKLALGRTNIFELVFDDCLVAATSACNAHGVLFGIGGIGKVSLSNPTPNDILARTLSLGASWTILNRSFSDYRGNQSLENFRSTFDTELKLMNELFCELDMKNKANLNAEALKLCTDYLIKWYRE